MREVIVPLSISTVCLLICILFQQVTCSSSQQNDKPFGNKCTRDTAHENAEFLNICKVTIDLSLDLEEKRSSNKLDDCSNSTCSTLPPFFKNMVPKLSKIKADLIHDFGCPLNLTCSELPADCIICDYNNSCTYGSSVMLDCRTRNDAIKCGGSRFFTRNMTCQYCYQMPEQNYVCSGMAGCNARTAPRQFYRANCTAHSHILCLGQRQFSRNLPCNWTSGYKWSTALVLSITLGGFGADRFYLGHWQEGIGKLFSFGGLGVWTLIDVALIAIGYLGPADGSLYV